MTSFFDTNRQNWDERADIHIGDRTGSYGFEQFFRGEDILTPIEAAEIGDIAGLDALHLQCHIGLDTLCLVRRGARATGLDFSENALGHARELAAKAGLAARFVHGNVYDAPALIAERFDFVFTTWGTISWLPDIRGWGRVISAMLRPGGRFYFADCHPGLAPLEEVGGRLEPTFNWRTPTSVPLEFNDQKTYTGDERPLRSTQTFEWIHPLGDILMALVDAGLRIARVAEHEALPWQMFPMMQKGADRLWRLPAGVPRLPLAVSLTAEKPA